MNIRLPLFVTVVIVGAMLAVSLWAWPQFPVDARIVTHWDFNGRPNGHMGKTMGLFLAPALAAVLGLLFALFPRIEPRKLNLASSAKYYRAMWIGALCVLGVAHGVVVAAALHAAVNVTAVTMGAVGVLYIVMGNYLGKTRSNFFAGVRTPWTLTSEYSWERTHRLTGKLFMVTGAATLAALAVYPARFAVFILLALSLATAATAIAMSYVYWMRDPGRDTGHLVH